MSIYVCLMVMSCSTSYAENGKQKHNTSKDNFLKIMLDKCRFYRCTELRNPFATSQMSRSQRDDRLHDGMECGESMRRGSFI